MATTKTEFPIHQLGLFTGEIFGLINTSNGETVSAGLLQQNLTQKVKQHLRRLGVKLQAEEKLYKDTVLELYKKYGTEAEDGTGGLTVGEDQKDEFVKEMNSLNETIITVEHEKFSGSDLDFGKSALSLIILDYIDPVE